MHIPLTLLTLALLVLLTDPFMVFMNAMQLYIVLALLTTLLIAWVGLVVREESNDEREVAHRAFAARMGYIAGISVLGAGVLYEAFIVHTVSLWSIGALAVMLAAKTLSRVYIEQKN